MSLDLTESAKQQLLREINETRRHLRQRRAILQTRLSEMQTDLEDVTKADAALSTFIEMLDEGSKTPS